MAQDRILITGATGQLGSRVIDALIESGSVADLVALVRPKGAQTDQRSVRLTQLGVEIRTGDYDDPASLHAAMRDVGRLLFISSNSFEPRRMQHGNVIEAAKAAGVGFVAYTSILNARDTPLALAKDHRETEEMLAASGLQHTVLRNGWYIENHMLAVSQALQDGAILGAAGDGRFSSAARADYAGAAAIVMRSDVESGNRILELAGDRGYTLAELAAEIARQSGTPVRYRDMAPTAYQATLLSAGTPDGLAMILADTDAGAASGALHDDSGTLAGVIGRPTSALSDAVSEALATQAPERT